MRLIQSGRIKKAEAAHMQSNKGNKRKLLIFGVSEMSERMHRYFDRCSAYNCAGFVIDRKYRTSDTHLGLHVYDFETLVDECPPTEHDVFVAVGYTDGNRAREEVYGRLESHGYQLVSFIAPSAAVHIDELGIGAVVLDHAIIGPSCAIGRGVYVGPNSVAGHHIDINDFVYVSSSVTLLGGCSIGKYVFLGGGVIVRDGISIADNTFVGMGAVVTRSIEVPGVYAGHPARLIREF